MAMGFVAAAGLDPTVKKRQSAWSSANTQALKAYTERYDAAKAGGAKDPYATATTGPAAEATNQNALERKKLDAAGLPKAAVTGVNPPPVAQGQLFRSDPKKYAKFGNSGSGFGMFRGLI